MRVGLWDVAMIHENDIRAQILELQSLDEFEDWLVQRSWNMHLDSESRAQNLVGKIELALAEYHDGHISEPALRQRLRSLAFTYEVVFSPNTPSQNVSYTSSSMVQIPPFGLQASTVSVS